MKKISVALFILFLLFKNGFTQNIYPVIPLPQQVIGTKGHFKLNKQVVVQDFTKSQAVKLALQPLKDKITQITGNRLQKQQLAAGAKTIQIRLSPKIDNIEGYQLHITPTHISIKAKTAAGVFYAVQTLLQLISTPSNYTAKIPCTTIIDAPRFEYRGIMLDVARHFMPLNFLKKYIDELARLKINKFHWHLSDGQAVRFESKKYPLLHYAKSVQWPTNEGFYTQAEMKALVKYAQERFVTIIPEIDVPSHSQALLTAYPAYGCLDSLGKSFSGQGEICPNENSIAFVKNLLDELIQIFPSKYIHIGGDEANKANWKNCPVCKSRMKELNLNTVEELQSSFVSSLAQHLHSKGRKMIGWDEIMEGGLSSNATVMAWRSSENGAKAAQLKHEVIMSPTSHCYLDYYQSENPNEPVAFNGYINLAKIYSFEPIPAELNAAEKKYILGTQANLWTEEVPTQSHAEYMTFPRALALAEVAWSNPENKNYADFLARVPYYLTSLTAKKINYAKHFYEININVKPDGNQSFVASLFSANNNAPLFYTLDGSTPNQQSNRYQDPIHIRQSTIIKVASVMKNEIVDETVKTISINQATGISIALNTPPNRYYNKGGAQALTNGIIGNIKRFSDNEWLAWNGSDFEGSLTFPNSDTIQTVTLRFFHQPKSWIWMPKKAEIWISADGLTFTLLKAQELQIPDGDGVKEVSITLAPTQTKFLKIKVQTFGSIPNNFAGAGQESWLFVDEISVK